MFKRSIQKTPETVAVLDIGSSKVVCLIGREEPGMGVRLIGTGFGVSAGVKNGAVIDLEAAEAGIRSAVEKAERSAGVTVQGVNVNVALRSLRSQHMRVQTEFASGGVADRDLKRVLNSGLSELSEPDYAILHAIPVTWSVDGETGIDDPRGMFGKTLGVDMHFVLGGVGPLRNLAHCIERCHLQIRSVTASPYASAMSVLTEDERDLGVTVVDMGAGVTSVAVFRDKVLMHVDAIGMGGQSVTNDIARGMSTPPEAAERIKTIYGTALHGANDDYTMVPCPPVGAQDTLQHHPKSLTVQIIRSRIEETFELISDRLHHSGMDEISGRQIVLTGGGAQLNGVRELAELKFNKRVRIGQPHGIFNLNDTLLSSDFAVATGLLKQAFEPNGEAIYGPPDLSGRRFRERRYSGHALGRSFQWLRENF
ncbi:cell division protein FtsA [Litorimonas taeanensis]|uniref:Cell division protein FtsA n=1 Tax=Litorimonas taeanensis TaxID=568099 RepID=A0A420WL09_9PROT|nr:cell division protein FtsA [Litorimonas taeanensis]RKQ71708.1 cell division protein FtsA [Litorimonas taeanensis]